MTIWCQRCGGEGHDPDEPRAACRQCGGSGKMREGDPNPAPPGPGTPDEQRVASLRSSWSTISRGKPGMRSVQKRLKPDIAFLLTLAEEALLRRQRIEALETALRRLATVTGELSYNQVGDALWTEFVTAHTEALAVLTAA